MKFVRKVLARNRIKAARQSLAQNPSPHAYAALAKEYSVAETADEGGRIPPVVRGEAALARLAFSTPVGEVGGPVREGERWLFLRVVSRPAPLVGTWSEIAATVEASLVELPIEDPEFWQWKADLLARHEVDMTPLLELVGRTIAD